MPNDNEYFKKNFFCLERYHASAQKFSADEPEQDEATVKLRVPAANLGKKKVDPKYVAEYQPEDKRYVSLSATATGDGTVDALDSALRKILVPVYPFLGDVRLVRYSVQNVTHKTGTSSEVEVFVLATNKAGKLYYSAVYSKSVIEASFFALANIYNRFFSDEFGGEPSKRKGRAR